MTFFHLGVVDQGNLKPGGATIGPNASGSCGQCGDNRDGTGHLLSKPSGAII